MRLLDTHTFPPPQPEDKLTERDYAILSHTWGENEVVFDDLGAIPSGVTPQKDAASWYKMRGAQHQARENALDFIWIDTVCIDKSSSAELSEAINSMWRWYRRAAVCFVYLSDVDPPAHDIDTHWSDADDIAAHPKYQQFRNSRWFRRGWTLQELIAPSNAVFFDNQWNYIGTLCELIEIICGITRIDTDVFSHTRFENYSIAQRMSWAANRECTRPEDRAYSLLGLLDINLDIRYGEGDKAFIRLQEEIISQSADQSIFAWGDLMDFDEWSSYHRPPWGDPMDFDEWRSYHRPFDEFASGALLARSPDAFAKAGTIISLPDSESSYTMTNRGLRLTAPVVNGTQILLNCRYLTDPTVAIGLIVGPVVNSDDLSSGGACLPPKRRRQEDYVSIQVSYEPPTPTMESWSFLRLCLLPVTQVSTSRTSFRELTIARKPDHRKFPVPEWTDGIRSTGRLWVVFEGYRPFEHAREGAHLVSSLGPPLGRRFYLIDSQPASSRNTRGLTYEIEAAKSANSEEHRSFDLHLGHDSGHDLSLRVDTTSERKFAYLQMRPIPIAERLDESGRLPSVKNPSASNMLGKLSSIPPLMRVHIFDRKFTAIAVLQKEDLNGERPYVLRVAMVRTSLKILWMHVVAPRLPRLFFLPKEIRDPLMFGIPITSLIVSIAILVPWPASIILLILIMIAAGVHIYLHSPLSSRRDR